MSLMPNNLDTMIKRADLSKREVGAATGNTPETVSRHCSGKIALTVETAGRYAKVLDCTVQDVLFATEPLEILLHGFIDKDGNSTTMPSGCGVHKKGRVYIHSWFNSGTAVATWKIYGDYSGWTMEYHDSITFIRAKPIKEFIVDPDCVQSFCYAALANSGHQDENGTFCPEIVFGILYPEPKNLYTIYDPSTAGSNTRTGQRLLWATPKIGTLFRPDLRDIDIVYD